VLELTGGICTTGVKHFFTVVVITKETLQKSIMGLELLVKQCLKWCNRSWLHKIPVAPLFTAKVVPEPAEMFPVIYP
jgi:hypothetical protein